MAELGGPARRERGQLWPPLRLLLWIDLPLISCSRINSSQGDAGAKAVWNGGGCEEEGEERGESILELCVRLVTAEVIHSEFFFFFWGGG